MTIATRTAKTAEPEKGHSISRTKKPEAPIGRNSPMERILLLQRTVGNQVVQGLFKSDFFQAKLRIGPPGDKYEQEADRIADQVMWMPEPQMQPKPT